MTLNNACYAVARLKLKEIVDIDDAKEVVEFFKEQIEDHLSKIDVVPYDPCALAVEEMVKELASPTRKNFQYEWTELLSAICKRDDDNAKWISNYVGKIDIIANHRKLTTIRTRLKEYALGSSKKQRLECKGSTSTHR